MPQSIKKCLVLLLIASFTILSSAMADNARKDVLILLKQTSDLDREISEILGKANAPGPRAVQDAEYRKLVAGFRVRLNQLLGKAAKLDRAGQQRVLVVITGAMHQMDLLIQARKDAEVSSPENCTPGNEEERRDDPVIHSPLEPDGSISGRVTDVSGGAGMANVGVDIHGPGTQWVANAYTNSLGYYTVNGLAPGNYFAVTNNFAGYVDELYDNIPCAGYCPINSGTPIPVASGQGTANINFALSRGAKIKGKVTDAETGLAIPNGVVSIYDSDTYRVSSATLKSDGTYIAGGLPAGDYYALVESDGYISEYYDNYPCPLGSCSGVGTPITVSGSGSVSGINFALTRGGVIAGSVRDSISEAAIDGQIEIYDELGSLIAYGYTDASGAYSVDGLPTGVYYAAASTNGVYVDEIFENIPWTGSGYADALSGTPVNVTAPQTTLVNFDLDVGGTISGTLTNASTGLPVHNGVVQVYDQNSDYAGYGISDPDGFYRATGLRSGTYRAVLSNTPDDYLPMAYKDIPCNMACDLESATPIPVTAPQDTGGIDFALTLGGRISGTLSDAASGIPLDYGYVDIYNGLGEHVAYGYTYVDYAGAYSAYPPVPAGSYYLRANSYLYISELYDNIPCPWEQCDPPAGTPIPVTSGATTTGIDVAFSKGTGAISGTITDSATGLPLADMQIQVYNPFRNYSIRYAKTDTSGNYTAQFLPAGSYFVRASGPGHAGELYGGVPCPFDNCDPGTGSAVSVQNETVTTGIDIVLDPAGFIHGVAIDGRNGETIQDVTMDIFDSSGEHVAMMYTDSTGSYTVEGLPDGDYYVRAYGMGFYAVELYDDITCIDQDCDPLGGTPIPVTSAQSAGNINFTLLPSGGIRGIVRDRETGAGLANLTVKVLYQDGTLAVVTQTSSHGIYGAYGFPPGGYYVIVEGGDNYPDQLYSGISCPDTGCNLAQGTLIHITDWRTISPINFSLSDSAFLFSDEFEDGQVASDWTFAGSWSESQGAMVANALQKKASAYAEPAFSGCTICSLDLTVEVSPSADGKIWIFGWHNGKNRIELLMKDPKDTWILKERVNGTVVQKAKGMKPISPDTEYEVRMTYDGSRILVFIDDPVTPLISITPTATPFGTAGLAAKYVTGSFGYIHIE